LGKTHKSLPKYLNILPEGTIAHNICRKIRFTYKKRKKCFLCAAALLVLWMLSPTPTVVNDLSRLLLHTAHTQMPCTTSTITYSKFSPRGATSYGYTNKTQYETRTVQRMQCRPAIENSDCWFDCCYLTDAPCCFVKLPPADKAICIHEKRMQY